MDQPRIWKELKNRHAKIVPCSMPDDCWNIPKHLWKINPKNAHFFELFLIIFYVVKGIFFVHFPSRSAGRKKFAILEPWRGVGVWTKKGGPDPPPHHVTPQGSPPNHAPKGFPSVPASLMDHTFCNPCMPPANRPCRFCFLGFVRETQFGGFLQIPSISVE